MHDLSLNRLLLAQVEKRPTKTALQFGDESLSYAELDRRASQVARGLLEQGIEPGDRVAYLGKNSIAYFEFLLGAAKARAITVPISWRLALPEINYVLGNSRAKLLLAEAPFDDIGITAPRLISGGSMTPTRAGAMPAPRPASIRRSIPPSPSCSYIRPVPRGSRRV